MANTAVGPVCADGEVGHGSAAAGRAGAELAELVDLVVGLCAEVADPAAGVSGGSDGAPGRQSVLAVDADPLDGTVWLWLHRNTAVDLQRAIQAYGLAVVDRTCAADVGSRLQVTGWDPRLLRRRLALLLAGIDDLSVEWDATAELVHYHYRRRAAAGEQPDPSDVLADVEQTLLSSVPIPVAVPAIDNVGQLQQLITAAEDRYQQLLAAHLAHAEHLLGLMVTG